MEHKGEHDWYHEILTGAMKYLSEESTWSEERYHSHHTLHFHGSELIDAQGYRSVKKAVIVNSEAFQKPSFVTVISSGPVRNFRHALIRSISEKMNIDVVRVEREGMVTFELKPRDNPSQKNEISEEEITEKITEQLAMVIEESLHELKELRANFSLRRERANEEFRKRLLEISNGVHGGAA